MPVVCDNSHAQLSGLTEYSDAYVEEDEVDVADIGVQTDQRFNAFECLFGLLFSNICNK